MAWNELAEAYSETSQTSKIEPLVKNVLNGFYSLTIFTKNSFLDVWQGSK